MPRGENQDVVANLFTRLHSEFEEQAPQIIEVMVECLGKSRITFPDFDYLYRLQRDRLIINEFNGANHSELEIKYRLSKSRLRDILKKQRAHV